MQQPADDFDPAHAADHTVRTVIKALDQREEKRWKWVQWVGGVLVAAVGIALAIPAYIRTESHDSEHQAAIGELTTRVKGLETKLDMLIMFSARQTEQANAVAKAVHAPVVPDLTPPPATVKAVR